MQAPLTTPCQATLIFAIGGVLMDWNPRKLYRAVSPNDELEISFDEWKHLQDACGLL
jgi:hypothetical protein